MSLISLIPLILNIKGDGMGGIGNQFLLLKTVLGNMPFFLFLNKDEKNNENLFFYLTLFSDFFYSLVFFISIYLFRFIISRKKKEVEENTVSAADYTLQFSGFPANGVTKTEIYRYIKKFTESEIMRIDFAYKFKGSLSNMLKIVALAEKKKKIFKLLFDLEIKKENLDKKITLLNKYEKIDKSLSFEFKKLKKKLGKKKLIFKDIHNNFDIKFIFITFNKPNALIEIYDKFTDGSSFLKCNFSLNKNKNTYKGKKIKISIPDHPNNINFENLETPSFEKTLKIALIFITSILIIIFFFLIQIYFRSYIDRKNPTFICNPEINYNEEDLINVNEENSLNKEDVTFCYCSNLTFTELLTLNLIYCSDYSKYILIDYLGITSLIAIILAIVNTILEIVIAYLVNFVKSSNKTSVITLKFRLVFILSYINTAFTMIVLYSLNFTTFLRKVFGEDFVNVPKYALKEELDRFWYSRAGSKILTVQIVIIFSPGFFLVVLAPLYKKIYSLLAKRKKLQYDYIKKKIKEKFELHFYITQIILLIFFSLTFSGGFPLCIPLTAVGFFICFWSYKIFFIYYSKKPPLYGYLFIQAVNRSLPYSLIIHLTFSIFFYSQEAIFPSSSFFDNKWSEFFKDMNVDNTFVEDFIRGCGKSLPLFVFLLIVIAVLFLEGIFYKHLAIIFTYGPRSSRNKTYRENYDKIKYNSKPGYNFTYLRKYSKLGEIFRKNCFFFFNENKRFST